MKANLLAGAFASVLPLASAAPKSAAFTGAADVNDLFVSTAPNEPKPYILPKMAGRAVAVGQQIYRFSVTGNASAGAFTLMQTNAPSSTALGVLPHIHKEHYENFYCTKGRFQLWAQSNSTANATQQARVLTQGDYGAVPQGTIHSFQVTDPDTQLTGIISPGGFEELFIAIGDSAYTSSTGSEYVPAASNSSSSSGAGSSASLISALESFDVYAQLDFVPRRDLVNGTAGDAGTWHTAANALAKDTSTPAFVAKGYGPKYLWRGDAGSGQYAVVAPLVTETQSAGNFTMGTITLSPRSANASAASLSKSSFPVHTALQIEEGEVVVEIDGFAGQARAIQGDVVFVPKDTKWSWWATRPFTKVLYVSGGTGGVEEQFVQEGESWDWITYPIA
ncbi:RmlC-like cupin domain-containing protein [Phyllosticta citribraziliensis]|uniref:RmlC-like cupin domain-containing protein n=1 Tax=Phyllosticta citribraziliensis TaxID=989973 RepID=A0ABR1LH30_9PEZI